VVSSDNNGQEQPARDKQASGVLPLWRKLVYATGTFGDSLSFNAASFYLLFYLTDIIGMGPADAGLLLALPAFLLFPLDPMAGALSDRVSSRFGRRRVFLLLCSPVVALGFFLRFFAPPGWNIVSLFFYWLVVQIAFSVGMTLLLVSYSALTAELSPSNTERAQLVSMQQGFGVVGTMIGSALTIVIVQALGGGTVGYGGMAALYAMLIFSVFMLAFSVTKTIPQTKAKRISVRNEALLVVTLPAFRFQFSIWLLTGMVSTVVNALLIFYVGYVLGMEDMFAPVMLLVMLGALVSLPFWNHLSCRIDKRHVFAFGAAMFAVSLMTLYFLTTDNLYLLWSVAILAGAGTSSISFLRSAMITDLIAYDSVQVGRSRAGNITGLVGLGNRAGGALGSLSVGLLLALIGYSSGVPVTPQLTEGLRLVISVVPGFLCALLILLLMKYPLTSTKITEAEKTLRSGQCPYETKD